MKIPLIKLYITEGMKRRVGEVLDSGMLTEGKVTAAFETGCRDYLGVSHCLAVTSCTAGIEAALRCLGITAGDEVIVPDYTYPATASVPMLLGATVVLVDIDPQTMLIDYDAMEAAITPRTKALVPVSLFGNPLDYDRLTAISHRYDLPVVEDAACAFGASYRGRRVGGFADISVFSLHPRKFITTGEGGLITAERKEYRDWLWSYKHFGLAATGSREAARFIMPGTNYKMSDLLAAVGLEQLAVAEELLSRRQELAARYHDLCGRIPGFELPQTTPNGVHSYQTCCVMVPERDRLLTRVRQQGIEVQIGTYCLHRQPAFQPGPRCRWADALAGSAEAGDRCLALPLFHDLTDAEQDAVVAAIGRG
ncbi:MAG: DegT/DnrJ/EryC1/StrS family aminotransferase [Deltaproteobacteria bacterium]|nr:DegT/DnrJ/EryC1/StrS family aminotransferase [Candidatus Anaeroferrophillacea bacterium]